MYWIDPPWEYYIESYVNVVSYSRKDKWYILPFDLKPLCILDVWVEYLVVVQTLSITG